MLPLFLEQPLSKVRAGGVARAGRIDYRPRHPHSGRRYRGAARTVGARGCRVPGCHRRQSAPRPGFHVKRPVRGYGRRDIPQFLPPAPQGRRVGVGPEPDHGRRSADGGPRPERDLPAAVG